MNKPQVKFFPTWSGAIEARAASLTRGYLNQLLPHHEFQDLMQEAFLSFWRCRNNYKGKIDNPRWFMSLFSVAWSRRLCTLAEKVPRYKLIEDQGAEAFEVLVYDDLGFFLRSMSNMPNELAGVLREVISFPRRRVKRSQLLQLKSFLTAQGAATMATKDEQHPIEKELLELTGEKAKGRKESDEDYQVRICTAVNDVEDDDYEGLSDQTKLWFEAATQAINDDEPENIPPFADFDEKASKGKKGKAAPKEEAEDTPAGDESETEIEFDDIEVDMKVRIVPKKGDEVIGTVTEVDDVSVTVEDDDGQESVLKASRVSEIFQVEAEEKPKKKAGKAEAAPAKKGKAAPKPSGEEKAKGPSGSDALRILICENLDKEKDAVFKLAKKKGVELSDVQMNSVYATTIRTVEILRELELLDE